MTKQSVVTTARVDRRTDRDLLAALGLGEHASTRDVESAHEAIVAFLETAPEDVVPWARDAAASADEAYALLADPTSRAAAQETVAPPAEQRTRDADVEGDAADPGVLARLRGPRGRRLAVGAGVVALAAIVVGVYKAGGGSGGGDAAQATTSTGTTAAAQVDQAKVATLMRRVTANPTSAAPLIQLGDLYYQAGDYTTAAQWMGRALKLKPGNATARLALGAAWFNMGRRTAAERQWRRVLAANPRNVEAHYDLGFLYLSSNPPDTKRVRAEWGKVVALAPKSSVAKTVKTHLSQLDGAGAAGTTAKTR